MKTRRKKRRRYEVGTYDLKEVEFQVLAAEEHAAIDLTSRDFAYSTVDGTVGFRTREGKWIEHEHRWPGVGEVGLKLLQALLLNAGDYLGPKQLAALTGVRTLRENGNVAARVSALRKALGNSGEWFIETRRIGGYAVRWNPERTWIWVEGLPADDEDSRDETDADGPNEVSKRNDAA
jgi:DNA-binding winged helix-turn-helix (wHTH) protein